MENLTVVIPFFNGEAYIHELIQDIPSNIPVIIVDDLSDKALSLDRPNVKVYRLQRKGYFTGACNHGIELCNTDVLILNQDVRLAGTEWLNLLTRYRNDYALIGEKIKGNHPTFPHGYVHGVFQFMRRDAITKVGLMNAELYPLWGASALWQLQICRKGFKSLPVEIILGLSHKRRIDSRYGDSILTLLQREKNHIDYLVKTPPEVSVIVPCYNYGRYLEDSINSLIGGQTSLGYMNGQSFQSFEVIIVNDGSTDETAEIAQSYLDGWNGIRYIEQPNGGTPVANNAGIKLAVGKYCTHHSADDMRESWSLKDLYDTAILNPNRIIYDDLTEFGNGVRSRKWPLAEYDFENLLERNMMPAGIFFPRQAWKKVGGYPEAMRYGREDWAFNVALGQAGYCGLRIDRSGYLYRREGQNRTLTNGTPEWRNKFLTQMHKLFPHLYRGERPMGCCGKSRPSNTTRSRGERVMTLQQNSPDMVLIEYIGTNVGSVNWGGSGTVPSRRYYRFGNNGRDKVKYVEQQDVSYFLEMKQEGKAMFRQAQEKPPVSLPPEPQMEKPQIVMSSPDIEQVQRIVEIPDINALNSKEIAALELTPEQWKLLTETEQQGKNRVTVLNLAKERLHASTVDKQSSKL